MKLPFWFTLVIALAASLLFTGILLQLEGQAVEPPATHLRETIPLSETPVIVQAGVGLVIALFGVVALAPLAAQVDERAARTLPQPRQNNARALPGCPGQPARREA